MPMDEYDMGHTTTFLKTVNIYKNSNVDIVVKNHILTDTEGLKLSLDEINRIIIKLCNDIQKIRHGLDVLDIRLITSISMRYVSNQSYVKDSKTIKWILFNIFRGSDYNTLKNENLK